jgi:uncharacterized protein (TIGR02996 family)
VSEDRFLAALLEHPDDAALRLVYADWLEEQGDPRNAFLRLESALAALPPGDERRGELRARLEEMRQTLDPKWLALLTYLPLGGRWRDHFLAGMRCVHRLLYQKGATAPRGEVTLDLLLHILNDLAAGVYQSANYFTAEPGSEYSRITSPPKLDADREYFLIGVNANTSRGRARSIPRGGVAFEDPFWALLAAHAIGYANPPAALPQATDHEDLWRKAEILVEAVDQDHYQASAFFEAIFGFIPPATSPRFELLTIHADTLVRLRTRSCKTFDVNRAARFYELFALADLQEDS